MELLGLRAGHARRVERSAQRPPPHREPAGPGPGPPPAGAQPMDARARRPTSGRRSTGVTADRDALLKALFPKRRPPREDVIRAVNSWLDDAERLMRMA